MYVQEEFSSTKPAELKAIIGKHFIYTYDNGWQYEMYIKNAQTIDYRIHSGMVGGRWVKEQKVHLIRLSDDVYKVSWDEPTGTDVSVTINLQERHLHGVIFFPHWIAKEPTKTVCYQNDHFDKMLSYRDAGPTYPKLVVDEAAKITFMETCAPDDESVVACGIEALPEGYAARQN